MAGVEVGSVFELVDARELQRSRNKLMANGGRGDGEVEVEFEAGLASANVIS